MVGRVYLKVILALGLSFPVWADTPTEGLVVSVYGGDTLTVLVGKQQIKVRLAEIDEPQLHHPSDNRSNQSLADLCFQESAKVQQSQWIAMGARWASLERWYGRQRAPGRYGYVVGV